MLDHVSGVDEAHVVFHRCILRMQRYGGLAEGKGAR